MKVKVGIIGGTGLDDPDILEGRRLKDVTTPFGPPSDSLVLGEIKGVECVLLARHGRKHHIYPTNVNYRANIHAIKQEGCTHLIATTACGSLRENYKPSELALVDQFIDRTSKRATTFYDGSVAEYSGICHMPMHTPTCVHTRKLLEESIDELGHVYHKTATVIAIEGPRFSTKAESHMFRSWGGDIINMTSVPEIPLAKEAGLCYAAIALVTDYDCWRDVNSSEHTSVEGIFAIMRANAEKATNVILNAIPKIANKDWTDIIKSYQDDVKNSTF